MAAYRNCKTGEVSPVGDGYGFSILSEKGRPLVALSFATRVGAEQARADVARAVERALEITPQG